MPWRSVMGEMPLSGPWHVAHCASSGCSAWVRNSQFFVSTLHVAMVLKPLQLASLVQGLPFGKPNTVGGSITAAVTLGSTPPSGSRVAKKTLSWQVPQAAREGFVFHASSTWQLVQFFSIATDAGSAIPGVPPVGIDGNPTLVKRRRVRSSPYPYSGCAAPGAS